MHVKKRSTIYFKVLEVKVEIVTQINGSKYKSMKLIT
jgi:hypothetical protein